MVAVVVSNSSSGGYSNDFLLYLISYYLILNTYMY